MNDAVLEARFRDSFSSSYEDARARFVAAAERAGARLERHVLPELRGAQGESLSMDVALLGAADASSLLVLSSGVHGVEGFCGSGCQVATLGDTDLLRRMQQAGMALLLVHAVNPYGFSHLRRTNEDNIDLNRNFIDFAHPPENPGYAALHDLVIPAQWPPTAENARAIADYIAAHGQGAFRDAVMTGQSVRPDGMFYSGTAPSWSHRTLREIVRAHGANRKRMTWMDVHTGLGPYGHCEKINAGPAGSHENLRLARAVWGADVFAPWEGESVSRQARGNVLTPLFEECPQAESVGIGLEFGTRNPFALEPLRADHWLHRYPDAASPEQRVAIKRELLEAFYVDHDEWRGLVWGQCRTSLLQACQALR